MSDSQATSLSVGFDAAKATAGAKQFDAAAKEIIGATKGVEAASLRVVESQSRQARTLDALERKYLPASAALRTLERDYERLNSSIQRNGDVNGRAANVMAAVQANLTAAQQAQAAGMRTAETVSKSFAAQTNQTSNAVRQLGIQSIDVFQQIASGAPVLTTFIQQGGQIGQVMAVTNTSIGSVARAIGGFVAANAGVIAATAGMIGFGAAIYTVFQRSSDLEAQQRQLSVAIAGTGRSAELSSTQLQGYVTQLKQQGVAAAEAQAAVVALARNPGLSGGAIARIVGLAPDAAAASGQSVQDATRLMSDAMKGTVESVQKLDDAFNLLTAAEAASVRQMIEHGDKGKALDDVFNKLQSRISGLNREALSPMEQAFRDIGNEWDGFMAKVVNSGPVVAVMSQLARDVRSISGAMFGNTGEALSQEIVGVGRQIRTIEDALAAETGAGRLADQRRQSMNAALAEYRAREQSLIDRARAEVPAGPPAVSGGTGGGSLSIPIDNASKSLAALAASRAGSSDAGRIASLTSETDKFRAALKDLDPAVDGNKALINDYTKAIAANEKSLAELNKKNETHRTGLEKATDTLAAQIKAQRDLAAAYGINDQAVRRVLATQEAEKKAISDGLTPGTAKYAAAVAGLTVEFERLADVKGTAVLAKEIAEVNEAVKSQERITAAYDGTQESLDRVQAQEKAHAAALKEKLLPGMQDYEATVSRLSESYLRSTDAAREFQHIQSSVQAITDILSTAFDRLGQGIVDAFLSGKGAAVNFGNIVKSIVASAATSLLQLGAVNPILNSFGGKQRDSLWSGLGALTGGGSATGGGGLSSLYGAASNASTLGGITDALGLTDFAGKLSGIGEYLGLTGTNGALSGIGSGISSFLGTGINGVGLGTATNTALSGLGAGVYGPAAPSSVLAAQGGATIGGMLSGVGLGFGAGSLAGGFLQSSLGKVGPAPTIGAGGGALAGAAIGSIIPGIGTVIGGLLGGLLGGAGGGLIGPKAATPFSATGLNKDANGLLSVGQTFSQIVDVSAEVAALQEQVSALNALLSGSGTRIANAVSSDNYGQARLIGGNSGQWLNFGQGDGRPGDLNAAFGELRFGSDNQYLNRGLEGQSFGTAEALQSAVSDILNFVNATAPALKALVDVTPSFGAGTLATTIDTLSRQFDDAKVMADRLGFAEYDLTEARAKAIQIANDNAAKQLEDSRQGLLVRFTAARGSNTGNLQMQLDAQLVAFDAQAAEQRKTFETNLKTVFGDAYAQTEDFAKQMAFLEATLGEERLSTAKSYLDAIAAANKQSNAEMERAAGSATAIITSITDYVRGVRFGAESPIASRDRYAAASSQFDQAIAAAQTGDAGAMRNLTSFAETFRSASRAQFGSGTQFVNDVGRIVSALETFAGQSPETLTNAVLTSEVRTQTATLAGELRRLLQEVAGLRNDMRLAATVPASRAA